MSESSLGEMGGLEVGFAYLEGTVTGFVGPPMSIVGDGFVTWPDGEEFPGVTIEDISGVADLGRPGLDGVDFAAITSSIAADGKLVLRHTDGAYELGGRYGFVLGRWDAGEHSALYGHDLSGDCPAIGFDTAHTRAIADRIVSAAPGLDTGQAIAGFVTALHAEPLSGPRTQIVEAVYGPLDTDLTAELCDQTFAPGYAVDQIDVIDRIARTDVAGWDGRVPLLDGVPDQLAGLDAQVIWVEPAIDSYFVAIAAEPGSDEALALGDFPGGVELILTVTTGTEEAITRLFESLDRPGRATVGIGWSTALVGEDVTTDCGEPSPEGYNHVALTWTDGRLVYSMVTTPVPECEPSPLSLADLTSIARRMVGCLVIDSQLLQCEPLDPTAPR